MSINSELPRLNPIGQTVLGLLTSLATNVLVYPICTIKNRQMATGLPLSQQTIKLRDLYKGYEAMCAVDATALAVALIVDANLKQVSSLASSIAAGVASSPFVTYGEGFMANRQVHALPYCEILKRTLQLRASAWFATMGREIPFTMSLFYVTPLLERHIQQQICPDNPSTTQTMLVQALAGTIGGVMAGWMTTPADLIKTRIQTSPEPLSIRCAVKSITSEKGIKGLLCGASMRALYIGIAGLSLHTMKNTLPHHFPDTLHTEIVKKHAL